MSALPILMYHHISPAPGLVTVSPQTFEAQMKWLADNGWRGVRCADVERFLAGGGLPKKSVLITFDDGYLDNWIHAHPVLEKYGLHAVLFIVTGWIGEGAPRAAAATPDHQTCKTKIAAGAADEVMLRWSEIEAMRAADTFEFHSHTHTHTRWDKQLAAPEAAKALARDLDCSRDTLAKRLGEASGHLCWPQGYFDASYIETARALGFSHLYTTEKRVVHAGADPLRLGRVVVKDRAGSWFARRLAVYSNRWLGAAYTALRGA